MARILLIVPWDGHLQVTPTLGVGYLKASAEAGGRHEVVLHDENFLEDRDGALRRSVEEFQPDLAGITYPSSATTRMVELLALLRRISPGLRLFAGGYHPSSEPELTLRFFPELDFVVRGEAESFFSSPGEDWKSAPGISWLEGDAYRERAVEVVPDIDALPYPDRFAYDPRYFRPRQGVIAGIYGKTATIITSRGCPFSCRFCAGGAMHAKVRYHGTARVLTEIEHILTAAGAIDYLYILDVMFLSRWSRVEDLCRSLIREGYNRRFRWAATVSANVLTPEKARLMKEAGCFYLSFGFESASPRVLKIINKKATAEDNRRACDICRTAGIFANSAFLFGVPGETEDDLNMTIEFVKQHNVAFTGVNVMLPLPGSPFYRQFVEEGRIRPSLEEWQRIASIHGHPRIFNDTVAPETYGRYIELFTRTIRRRERYNSLRANWRMRIKYLFGHPRS